MIHDQRLVDRLTKLPPRPFEEEVYRATRVTADPTAPSVSGGRWAPPPIVEPGIYVLYTSVVRDGAIAEVASFLAQLTPIPGPREIKVTRLAVTASRTLRLARANLESLGVDWTRYGERDYDRTQEIGAALAFLDLDGLVAPSARWPCDNFMIFTENHALSERLEPVDEELVEWQAWARANGILPTGA